MSASEPAANSSSRAARNLGDLLASIEVNADWSAVEITAQSLANGLRIRGGPVDEHTALGRTLLPQTLTLLLKAALEGQRTPDDTHTSAIFELLRVGANLCMDHNENRGYLLDSGFPQLVVSLLEGYAETLPEIPSQQPIPLSNPHLGIIKTAIGALLNLSLGYEPVQTRLISLEVPVTLLRLSISIYPPGAWLLADEASLAPIDADCWLVRKGISDWSWRAISSLKDNQTQQSLFGPESLPYLVVPLKAFVPPFSSPTNPLFADANTRNSLLSADVEVLEETCELIESITMDVEDARQALARGMAFNEQPPCLALLLDFVEFAEYVPCWQDAGVPPDEVSRWRHAVDLCKTAVIKAIVEISGEEDNLNILWDATASENKFVPRMTKWLRETRDVAPSAVRDDLVICATLSLGNLVRKEKYSVTLVKPPFSITSLLMGHLTVATDMKVKHGVIGLLKHLAQSSSNRSVLGEAGVLEALHTCQIFSDKADIAEIVQMSAINLSKHLCTNNVANSIACVLNVDDNQSSTSCLSQVLALSSRSDSVPVRSEGARVLVNVIKSLCSSTGDLHESHRQLAIQAVTSLESAKTLARLLGRSEKHVILLNEAIVAMMLLIHQPKGAIFILDAVVAELPKEMHAPSRQNSFNASSTLALGNSPSSPVVGPSSALDMLVTVLNNTGGKFPAELRTNLCALLGELGREGLKSESGGREREVEKVRAATRSALEKTQTTPDSLVLSAAARKALETW
ncbi:hypothetical protein M0805_006820 [Coniferiporia weirii]|nr:hypothetical protein M0805_006820 [Coniferiporia weirii]